jgi:HEAT repeat protein
LLRSSFRDNDLSVRLQALEALVLLDDPKAKRLMTNYTRSAFDDECILAMMSLARAKVQDAKEQIRYIFDKNNSSDRLGMRLIAARAMALLGDDTGKKDALSALTFKATRVGQPAAIRQLAAAALGEMKDPMTLPYLKQTLNDEDPDVRIASVTAILKINQSQLPF